MYDKFKMSIDRQVIVDKIEIRPGVRQIGVTKVILNIEDGEEVSRNFLTTHYSSDSDLSNEDELVQQAAKFYWHYLEKNNEQLPDSL